MNHSNDFSDMARKGKEYLQEEGQHVLEQSQKHIKKSGKDWLDYVETHPFQTLIFGVIGYFALKGMIKD
ncbi:MAG: hypothetical protein H2069_06000 [Legionella sp.]|nr:hypothetical protein [Legionella sp.]